MLNKTSGGHNFNFFSFFVVAGAVTLFSASSVLQRNSGTENFWPGVMYLVAGGLFLAAALLGYFISHFSILNARDKRTKSFAVLLFIFIMATSLLVVGKAALLQSSTSPCTYISSSDV